MSKTQSILNVRLDENVKKQFDTFCSDVGMNASVAVNLFIKTVLRERRIPFDIVSDDPFYSKENLLRLEKAREQINNTGGKIHELIEVEDD